VRLEGFSGIDGICPDRFGTLQSASILGSLRPQIGGIYDAFGWFFTRSLE